MFFFIHIFSYNIFRVFELFKYIERVCCVIGFLSWRTCALIGCGLL